VLFVYIFIASIYFYVNSLILKVGAMVSAFRH